MHPNMILILISGLVIILLSLQKSLNNLRHLKKSHQNTNQKVKPKKKKVEEKKRHCTISRWVKLEDTAGGGGMKTKTTKKKNDD